MSDQRELDLLHTEFKRKFSLSFYKNLQLKLAEMSFYKDFISDKCGDPYPILEKSENCLESVEQNAYVVRRGSVRRLICQFFPYATYEVTAETEGGRVGLRFSLPDSAATLLLSAHSLQYSCNGQAQERVLPDSVGGTVTMLVSCRPGGFDVYFKQNGKAEYFCTFAEEAFKHSHAYAAFTEGCAELCVSGAVRVLSVLSYIDNGVSVADMRPIRYGTARS